MTIQFENQLEVEPALPYRDIITNVINVVLDFVDCPFEVELDIIITDNREIRKVNKEFRKIDKATDVLSFPMLEFPEPEEFEWMEDYDEFFNLETGELVLGSIVISMEKVWEQAKEYGHSVERELAFLTVHSMLHLCGHDHIKKEECLIMEEKQREIMDILGITRD